MFGLCLSLAQRYAEVRKGMGLKIVGYAADSILQVLVAKITAALCSLRLRAG